MAGRDYEFTAHLNDDQVLQALKNIDANVDKIANSGSDAFDRMGQSAEQSGVKIGAVAGIVTSLTNKLLEAGQAAIRFGIDAVKASTEAALGLETTEASLIGIFEGNEAAALASLDRIRQASLRLGVDLTELAPAFLPKVEDLQQFEKIGELVAGLARLDPAQGVAGARLALTEALAGGGAEAVRALRLRFELDTGPIVKAQEELGDIEGLIVGLGEVLKARGQDFESLGDTAAAKLGIAEEAINQLQTTLGEPILDQLKEELDGFIDLVTEELPNGGRKIKDEFVLIAGAVGDVVGMTLGIVGELIEGVTDSLDTNEILEFITLVGEAVSKTGALIENLSGLAEGFGALSLGGPLRQFQDINGEIEKLNKLLETANQLTVIFRLSQLARDPKTLQELFKAGQEGGFNLENFVQTIDKASEGELSEAIGVIEKSDNRIKDLIESMRDRFNKLKEDTSDVDIELPDLPEEEDTEALDEYLEAQEKLNKAFQEFDTDKARAEADLFLKQQRELIEFEIKASQEREKLARKNLADIAKIHRKHSDDIRKAAVDLSRDEEDIARKGAREQVELERDIARERIRAEEDFQRELQRIKARFEFDAQEAIRANDAIAFLAIQRRKDFEIEQAQEGRDETIQEAEATAVERREALQSQLQQEIEDAKIANARKLEDLRTSLQIELREQQIKYAQEVQEQAIAEQQKREALKKTQQEQIQDFNTYWQRRLEDLQRNYQKEIEITKRYEAQLAAIRASAARAFSQSRLSRTFEDKNFGEGAFGGLREIRAQLAEEDSSARTATRRHSGGRVEAGHMYLVGRPGAEEPFIPDVSGTVYPPSVMFNPVTAPAVNNTVNNINRTTNLNVEAMLNGLSPQQLAIVTQLIHQLNMSYIG